MQSPEKVVDRRSVQKPRYDSRLQRNRTSLKRGVDRGKKCLPFPSKHPKL
jgi:hypothetical protein